MSILTRAVVHAGQLALVQGLAAEGIDARVKAAVYQIIVHTELETIDGQQT